MTASDDVAFAVRTHGFAILPAVLDSNSVVLLIEALERASSEISVRQKNHGTYAIRNLLTLVPEVRVLADSPEIRALVEPVLGKTAFPVRGLLFDKTPDANWKVFWHQDLSISVRARVDVPGFKNWSIKAGMQYVEAPASVLENVLAIRIHLDDCDASNGPLNVLPGTHAMGNLKGEAIEVCKQRIAPLECHVPRGGALLMRPLLLHASFPAKNATHRRVIHLEFAAHSLPGGLEWEAS